MNNPNRTKRNRSAHGGANVLEGLRVLFLPKNSRNAFFGGFLRAAVPAHAWHTHIVCQPRTETGWMDIAGPRGGFTLMPDFSIAPAWESDKAECAALDGFISECEKASGISAGRILLAAERDLGRGFSKSSYNWFHNSIARQALADNTAPFTVLRRMFAFARATLEQARPDILIAGEWADALCFTFLLVARRSGIRCATNRKSKVWSGRGYWTFDPMMYNEASRAAADERAARRDPSSTRAAAYISNFRAAPTPLGYVKQVWDAADGLSWIARHGHLARLFAVDLRHRLGNRGGPAPKPPWRIATDHYRKPWLNWRQRKFFHRFDDAALNDMPYAFTAFHKDPEQALNYQAPFWSNQYNTISLLTTTLPAGFKLLVREHRMNVGRRPSRYYKDLSRLPGVVLIDGFDDQFKYIANADLVITDNGTIGWEALVIRRRVITLAESHYAAARLARRVREPERLASAVVEALEEPAVADETAHDQALGWFIDAEWETTAPIDGDDHDGSIALLADLLAEDDDATTAAAAIA